MMRILYILVAVLVGFGAFAQTEIEMARMGEQLISKGDTLGGIRSYINLLKRYPQSLPSTVRLMELKEAIGDFDTAIEYANVSLDLIDYNIQQFGHTDENKKDLAAVYYLKGKIRMKQENYWAALELLEKTIENNPEFSEGYSELARAYFETDKPALAMKILKEGIIKAESWKINYNLGILYTNTKNYDSARACFLRSLDLNPEMLRPHYFLGSWDFANEKYEEATEHYEEYMSKYTDNKEVVYNLATSYMNVEKYYEAISTWTMFLQLEENNVEAYRNRGLSYMYINDFSKAHEDFNKSISLKPANNYAYVNRGSVLYLQGDLNGALDDFDVIIADFPHYSYGYYYRALCYKSKNRKKKSCQDMKEALDLGLSEETMEMELIKYCTDKKERD
ncbi:MAG: tetratricopeptide repeat protein [Cyclobacteriaceae bacterium]|nr:tetratricopeptide repeat protein [Cyclobacteriaceae bacterium]